MAMSLPLVDYASSDEESDVEHGAVLAVQGDAKEAEKEQKTAPVSKPVSKLPSAAQMLGSNLKSSSMVAPTVLAPTTAAKSEAKPVATVRAAATKTAPAGSSKMFVPPQMTRPNTVTEDVSAWTTQRKHKTSHQEPASSNKRPKAETKT